VKRKLENKETAFCVSKNVSLEYKLENYSYELLRKSRKLFCALAT
jgi:hypothetical protein